VPIWRPSWRTNPSAATMALVLVTTSGARAFERQWHLGLDAGYAALFDDGASGFGGGAHAAYGLSDAFNALLELDVTRHPGVGTTVWSGATGVAYTLDVARAVPYGGILIAGYKLSGELSTTAPGAQLVLGLDYALERNWAVGAQLRFHTIVAANPVGTMAYATTFLRAEYVWGF
jgi:hypothetical protein